MKKVFLASLFVLTLVGLSGTAFAGSGGNSTPAPGEVRGVKNGAEYALFMPANWNGDLVLYAHGFIDPEAPIALPDVSPEDVAPWVVGLRDTLLSLGYGVAYSSYSQNGWAVADGAQRTRELPGLFTNSFASPHRIFVVGRSLGALITVKLVEQYPTEFNGALALCGPVGGGLMQTDYVANTRVLFDFFFPGVIPGDVLHVPDPPLDYSSGSPLVQAIVGAILADPQSAVALASVDQIELPWTGNFYDGTLINSIVRVLGYNIRGTNDLLARTGGLSPFGNTSTWYTGLGAFDATLNTGVGRFASNIKAINYLTSNYRPTGNLGIPLLTLHTTLDPDVPFAHEHALATVVEKARASKRLTQQYYARYGHCNFTPAETANALGRLVNWVDTRVQPASGALAP